MALTKTIPHPSGTLTAYWRITETHVNWLTRTLHVTLGGYISEETRRQGKAPLASWQKVFRGKDFPLTAEGQNVAQTYAALKTDPFFTGAEDA